MYINRTHRHELSTMVDKHDDEGVIYNANGRVYYWKYIIREDYGIDPDDPDESDYLD